MKLPRILPTRLFLSLASLVFAFSAQAKPLKVFILAGQSNMEGHAKIETFDYIGCAKTFALMGKAFAEANLALLRGSQEK